MSVWLCVPSKRQPEEAEKCLKLWRERGYRIALFCDSPASAEDRSVDVILSPERLYINAYPGYSQASNALVNHALSIDPKCDWVVLGGDDMEPDLNHTAEEIARECSRYFDRININDAAQWKRPYIGGYAATFGVMQPTGDRYGEDARSREIYGPDRAAYSDRVCGSPWIGREFALRINQGRGPLWPEYFHMFEDQELFDVASNLGVLWQRRDLIHYHHHWARARGRSEDMPEFLREVNSQKHWRESKAIYDRRKAAGFPGSEPK